MITGSEIAQIANKHVKPLDYLRKEGLLPVNDKTARRLLKEAGYTYNRTDKQWILNNSASIIPSPVAPTIEPQMELVPALTVTFNDDELTALKHLAQQLIQGNTGITTVTFDNPDMELYNRSRQLEKKSSTRKTYIVEESLASRFDSLADRSNIDKSQLLSLALMDFLTKYE